MKNKKGFTLVELLVVLLIIGILAAIAAPLYLANARKARASEAVATMSLIRQALRDYRINNNTYFTILQDADGNIQNPLPSSVSGVTPDPLDAGVNVDVGVAQYFSNSAFEVEASTSRAFTDPTVAGSPTTPVDFLITADGGNTDDTCTATDDNCAVNGDQVNQAGSEIILEMDNSGRILVSYDNGITWEQY